MADVLRKLTGAPHVLTFKGKRYELSPLGLTELAMAKAYLKKYIMDEAQKAAAMMAAAGAPEEHIKELWREAAVAFKKPMESDFTQDPVPLAEFVLMSLRKRNPEVTAEMVREMFDDPTILAEVIGVTQELNTVETEVKNS